MPAYKILIVEDEGLIALDIASRLEALGHTVAATAGTVEEALEQAEGADIVLMDIRLDGPGDGIEAATRIRERYHVPVIFLTAHADRSTVERAKHAGPYGYIVKPVASASLQTTIEIAIYKHGMERQLEESEAWFRAALGSVADAVMVTDPEGRVRTFNAAAKKLFEGKPAAAAELLPGDPVALAILEDAPVPIEARLGERAVQGCAAPVKASGTLLGAVITLRDVSAQRREQLRVRQMERGEIAARLAAGVANDYTNLIAIIRNQSEQLLRQFSDYSPVRQTLEEIQQAAAATDSITRRLAGLGARPPGRPEPLSLHGILRRMSRLIHSVAGAQVAVTIRPGAQTGKIHADAAQVEELLMRLVLYSLNAMPAGGELLIETGDSEEAGAAQVCLAVTHNGAPEPDLLDLSLAPYLNAEDSHRLEAFFPQWSEPVATAGTMPTLLLIEPRERIRAQLHNFFEAHGYNLLEAADDEQAKTLLELQAVDLLIASASQIDGVPLLAVQPPYTQQALLEQVRAAIGGAGTASAASISSAATP
jgi:two-component system cell cycle sensor histidine kinase/response regulator CckA